MFLRTEWLYDDLVCVCVCLLHLSYVEDKVNVNAYAGMLFEDDDKKNKVAGRRKSAALLASRLLMAGWSKFLHRLTHGLKDARFQTRK